MDPKVASFLRNHAQDEREAVRADIARYQNKTLEELGKELTLVCRMAAEILHASPNKEKILASREPPAESYFRLLEKYNSPQ